jgi:uncharacterized protein (TIRG00374 family)
MKKLPLLKYGLHLLVIAGLVVAGMKYVNGDEFWKAIHRFNWWLAPLILSLTVVYLVIKGWRFVTLIRLFSDVPRPLILRAYIAGQAPALLPGGIAARAAFLEQVGIPMQKSGAAVAMSSMSDQFVLFSAAMLSALWFESARKPVLILLAVLITISVLLGIEASRHWLMGVIEKVLGKLHLEKYWEGFCGSLKNMSSLPMLLGSVLNAAVAFSLMVAALYLSLRGVGGSVSPLTLLLAFSLPALLGRISALPGGVGVTEAGMIGILDAAPGITLDQAAAAVTIFRIGTTLFAAVFGAFFYFFGWNHAVEEHNAEADTPDPAGTLPEPTSEIALNPPSLKAAL